MSAHVDPVDLSAPALIQQILEALRIEIARKSNDFDKAAEAWFDIQPAKERAWAEAYVSGDGAAHMRQNAAKLAVAKDDWGELEGRYLVLKAKLRALESQAVICQSLLKTARAY